MNREEAQALIGRRVSAWTALNGSYEGHLVEVVTHPGRPWRGKVKITEYREAPFEREGYQIGDIIEVGHSSIRALPPRRIQRKRTKGWRMPAGTIYVGRPTKYWAPHIDNLSRAGKLAYFQHHLDMWADGDPEGYAQALDELRGHDLACWCPVDQRCHGDIWLERANCRCETYNWPLTAKGYICPNCRRIAQGVDFAMLRMRAYQVHCAEHPLVDFEVCTDPWCAEIVAEEVRLGLLELEP